MEGKDTMIGESSWPPEYCDMCGEEISSKPRRRYTHLKDGPVYLVCHDCLLFPPKDPEEEEK